MLKYEFDNLEEYKLAMDNLSAYHDCEKCRGKIVGIALDMFGNTKCGYCGKVVKYPRMSKELFKETLRNNPI